MSFSFGTSPESFLRCWSQLLLRPLLWTKQSNRFSYMVEFRSFCQPDREGCESQERLWFYIMHFINTELQMQLELKQSQQTTRVFVRVLASFTAFRPRWLGGRLTFHTTTYPASREVGNTCTTLCAKWQ